jgi:hypothetical protein
MQEEYEFPPSPESIERGAEPDDAYRNPLPAVLREARGWIADVTDEVPDSVTDGTVIILIDKNFDGGWKGFIASDQTLDPAVIWLLMVRRFGLEFTNKMFP